MTALDLSNNEDVLICEHKTTGTGLIGHAHLNMVGSLNALTLDAVKVLFDAISHWFEREDIAAVLLTGEGEKAFCAGGDIRPFTAQQ